MIDTHFHCFERGLRLAAGARYQPQYDAPLSELQTHWQAHGITRGVIVQPSFLGTDNSYLLRICEHSAQKIRGVAVVSSEISPHQLVQMHDQGVRGIRFNWVGLTQWPDVAGRAWAHVRRSLQTLNWHIELHIEGGSMAKAAQCFDGWKVPLVIDHLGRPSMPSLNQHLQTLLGIAKRRPTYIKVSAPYRCNADAAGSFEAMTTALLASEFADRLLWGSDWPFTQFEKSQTYSSVFADFELVCPDSNVRSSMARHAEDLYFSS